MKMTYILLAAQVSSLPMRRLYVVEQYSIKSTKVLFSAFTLSTVTALRIPTWSGFVTSELRLWFPASFAHICAMLTGAQALTYFSMRSYSLAASMIIPIVALVEMRHLQFRCTSATLLSLALMILGTALPAKSNLQRLFSKDSSSSDVDASRFVLGAIWMVAYCVCNAVYALVVRENIQVTNSSMLNGT